MIKVLQGCILKLLFYSVNSVFILYRTGNMQFAILLSFVASSSLLPCGRQSTHPPTPCYISPYVVHNVYDFISQKYQLPLHKITSPWNVATHHKLLIIEGHIYWICFVTFWSCGGTRFTICRILVNFCAFHIDFIVNRPLIAHSSLYTRLKPTCDKKIGIMGLIYIINQ